MKEDIELIENKIIDLKSDLKTFLNGGFYDSADLLRSHISDLEETLNILNVATVKLREECPNCHKDMKFLGMAYECKCGVVKLKKTLE